MWWMIIAVVAAMCGFLAILCSGDLHSAITYLGIILSIIIMCYTRRKHGNFPLVLPDSGE